MTALDIMRFLFYFSLACLTFASLDALALAVIHVRSTLRYRRLLCACGSWPTEDDCPTFAGGFLHESARCYPELES